MPTTKDYIHIENATENNLNHVTLDIPKHSFVVVTGPSGSGKSTLAFDTIYMESRRRYLDTLSMYAKQFVGPIRHPKVEKLIGVSPAIAVVQGSLSNNPRSTIGTVTEIYDILRLIWGRAGVQRCPNCLLEVGASSTDSIVDHIQSWKCGTKAIIYAPIVQQRKGEFTDLFEKLRANGFVRARIDGNEQLIESIVSLKKNTRHTIELIVDRIIVKPEAQKRTREAIEHALKYGNGICLVERLTDDGNIQKKLFSVNATCPKCGMAFPELSPMLLAFNTPLGVCESCSGTGVNYQPNPYRIIGNPDSPFLPDDKTPSFFAPFNDDEIEPDSEFFEQIVKNAKKLGLSPKKTWRDLDKETQESFIKFAQTTLVQSGIHGEFSEDFFDKFFKPCPCHACHGSRLNAIASNVYFANMTLPTIQNMAIDEAFQFFQRLDICDFEPIARRILKELIPTLLSRLDFLKRVGLGYLQLGRSATTLSGGEAQRIRLASMLGNGLTAVTYVLDEPSIGLHARDQDRLIGVLKDLRDLGNTVIAVEHDDATMRACDFIVDIGPHSGKQGGNVVYAGNIDDISNCNNSLTIDYLLNRKSVPVPQTRRTLDAGWISIKGARKHNLKNIDVDIPLKRMVCITGVSGSGKSTLINEVLLPYAHAWTQKQNLPFEDCDEISGLEPLGRVLEVDQKPIGKTPRSNPATYTKVFDLIRTLFAGTVDAKMYGYTASRFSFNVSENKNGGRCNSCEGAGVRTIEMKYLANTFVECEDCHGKRFNDATLRVRYLGFNIAQVLDMSFDEALKLFEGQTKITKILKAVCDVGLGYIKLGQPSPTLSGGEAQRMKLAKEIAKSSRTPTLFVFDEPSTGLHADDVRVLIQVFNKICELGHSIIIIEHNLDIIKSCDYIIDVGPEPGEKGGYIVAAGPPEDIAFCENPSHTGKYLRPLLFPPIKPKTI